MNRWQIAKQAQFILRNAVWPGTTDPVFAQAADGTVGAGSVIVTGFPKESAVRTARMPLAFIALGAEVNDPDMGDSPDLVRCDVNVGIVVASETDDMGEAAMVGANRGTGSDGRGLLEVEERVKTELLQVGPGSGLPIIFRDATAADGAPHPQWNYVAMTQLAFQATGTTFRTYQPPSGLAATGGAGQVALSWNASARWDQRRFILRYAAGTTPPATSSSGTGVALSGSPSGAGVTSVTVTGLSAGTYAFALFLAYDDDNSGTDAAVSGSQTVTATVT